MENEMKNIRQMFNTAIVGITLVTGMAGLSSCNQQNSNDDRDGIATLLVDNMISHAGSTQSTDGFKKSADKKDLSETFDIVTPGVSPVLYLGKKIKAAQKSGNTAELHACQQKLENMIKLESNYRFGE
jgi:hypothetical protein